MLEAVLPDLSESEAEALKDRIDGPRQGSVGANRNFSGRVMCLAPSHDGRIEVHIYMIHK
jgi:hypothetical protein